MLRPGGEALIIDMSGEASDVDIERLVDRMRLGPVDAMTTRAIFKQRLRKSAYTRDDFQRLASASPFCGCEICADSIGLEVWLRKKGAARLRASWVRPAHSSGCGNNAPMD